MLAACVRCRPITKVFGAAPELGRSILAAGQPSSCRPPTDRGCKGPFKEPPLTAELGGPARAALLVMRERTAEPEVRIHSPPAVSHANHDSARVVRELAAVKVLRAFT